jgi:hypothetical protein
MMELIFMVKSNYATEANVYLLLTGIVDDISAGLMTYSLTTSDNWANGLLSSPVSVTSTPPLVMQAAEYYSASFILRNLYDVSEGDSGTAIWYEKAARDLLNAYVTSVADENSEVHPYSSSLSPSTVYTERDLRSVYDPLIGEHDDVDDTWDSER